MTNTPIESWEKKIREDYAGILSPEQIEATIIYWGDFIRTKLDEAYFRGKLDGMDRAIELIRENGHAGEVSKEV